MADGTRFDAFYHCIFTLVVSTDEKRLKREALESCNILKFLLLLPSLPATRHTYDLNIHGHHTDTISVFVIVVHDPYLLLCDSFHSPIG